MNIRRLCPGRWRRLVALAALMAAAPLPAQEANYCLNRPLIASSPVVPGFPLENLTDGNRTTYTLPNDGSGTLGFYYQIDLGQVRELDRVVLWQRKDCCPERLRRYRVSLFGESGGTVGALNWTGTLRLDGTFAAVGTGDTIRAEQGTGSGFIGRYLRIENRSGESSNPQIAEVEAYPSPLPVIQRFDTDAGNLTAKGDPTRPTRAAVTWQVDGATSWSLSPAPGALAAASGTLSLSPAATTRYTLTATNAAGSRSATLVIGVDEPELPPFIAEFVAAPNASTLDEDGEGQDWIEIANPNPFALSLDGYHLTDDPSQPALWTFPAISIPAQGRRLVFASGKDRRLAGSPLHTNFSLRASGEYLALCGRDGRTPLSQIPRDYPDPPQFPRQYQGSSYGADASGQPRFFSPPTPGTENGPGFIGVVEDTSFSVKRGIFTAPQTVALTTPTPNATIRYTLNGSAPTETSGLTYTAPLTISATTVLRAAAFKAGFAPTNIDTHTYIFPESVKNSAVMATSITKSATYGPQVVAALTDLPSFSLVTPISIPNGIDVPASLELIEPGGAPGSGFQENCGIERFGGDYTDFAKKSFRAHFRQSYGVGRLNYPLFTNYARGLTPVESFNALEFRSGSHDMVDRGFYLSNPFTDALLLDMGSLNPHGRWVHLYYNGTYWGVYHLRERWDADHQSDYLGGDAKAYEAINGNLNVGGWAEPGNPYDGDGSAWARIKALRGNYAQVKAYVDVPQYIDYMLMFMFGDSEDEFRCVGPAGPGTGFKYLLNDADGWLRNSAGDKTGRGAPGRQSGDGPGSIFSMLYKENNPDYRILLADRIQRHFFNGGALTPARNIARLNELAKAMERPFIVESARWNYRTPATWLSSKNAIISSWFPTRTAAALAQLRGAGFFPTLAAPLFSQRGGPVAAGTRINLTSPTGTVYYTTDGSDPRLSGGALSPAAIQVPNGLTTESVVPSDASWRWFTNDVGLGASDVALGHPTYDSSNWKHPAFDDRSWPEGRAEFGYGEGDEATELPFGDPSNRFISSYFRGKFALPEIPALTAATLRLKRDDGAIVYLNGVERARSNLSGVVTGSTLSAGAADDGKTFLSYALPTTAFQGGDNTLAVELHQSSAIGSDASFAAELAVTRTIGGPIGVEITKNTLIRARVLNGTTWSALDEALFLVQPQAVALGDLAIAEINYHPRGLGREEFLELQNTSPRAVNLRGCRFTDGINYTFPDNRDVFLAPGQRLVLAEDLPGFQAKYGLAVEVAGRYFGTLANEGEALILVAADGTELIRTSYDDAAPGPTAADGAGATLVSREYAGRNAEWRSSAAPGGSPGGKDTTPFSGTPDADRDGDGLSAWAEYALGSSDAISSAGAPALSAASPTEGLLAVSFRRALATEGVRYGIETSPDLRHWSPPAVAPALASQIDHGDGTATETWTLAPAASGSTFVRLHLSTP